MPKLPWTSRLLLDIRYTFGYLAACFLISAPLQMFGEEGAVRAILVSLFYGGMCGLAFIGLLPLIDIEWEEMRLPAFKRFELAVTRNSWAASLFFLFLAYFHALPLLEPRTAWIVFVLTSFSFIKIKGHSLIFKEFYAAGLDRGEEEEPAPDLPDDLKNAVREKFKDNDKNET